MKQDRPIAHVSEDGRIHLLEEHLRETAHLAKGFADKFCAGELGYWVGLWHKAKRG